MTKKRVLKHKCPVCFNLAFCERGDYEICSQCHWEDDGSNQDSEGTFGPNHMSVGQYRKEYKGKKMKVKKVKTVKSNFKSEDWRRLSDDLLHLLLEVVYPTQIVNDLYQMGYSKKQLKELGFDTNDIGKEY